MKDCNISCTIRNNHGQYWTIDKLHSGNLKDIRNNNIISIIFLIIFKF